MRVDGLPCSRPQHRRGVAQPGRAPGSGPGGRRFKSSLPDQYFQALKLHFWFSVYADGVEIVDGASIACFLAEPGIVNYKQIFLAVFALVSRRLTPHHPSLY